MGKIVLEDFNEGNGYYKVNLAYLNKEQVEEIESLASKWNLTDEDFIDCIGVCLTNVSEQRFKDYGTNLRDCLAWLEKQGNKEQVEHLELKAGHWYICHRPYCCRADSLTVKEGEKFKCEKDGVVKGFVIKEPEKYFKEISVPAFIKDSLNDDVRRRSTIQVLEYARSLDTYNQYGKADIDKNIAWLEKQDNKPQGKTALEAVKEEKVDNANKVEPKGELTDKAEPKFHEGEWVTNGDYTWKIIEVKPLDYILQSQDGNIVDDTISHVDEQFHSFTIKDTKEGDVLEFVDHERVVIGIVSFVNEKTGKVDVSCLLEDHKFKIGNFYALDTINTHPATKEQCDSFFSKMKECGYTWNVEKKELKNIGFNSDDLIEESYQQQADDLIDMVTEKPAEWSEEDKEMIDKIIDYMMPMPIFFESTKGKSGKEYTKEFVKNATKWLKSLKQRSSWKPSDAQMQALKEACDEYWEPDGLDTLYTLYKDLEKLKGG